MSSQFKPLKYYIQIWNPQKHDKAILEEVWFQTLKEDKHNMYFSNTDIIEWGLNDWINSIKEGKYTAFIVTYDGKLAAFVGINDVRRRRAQLHFITFKHARRFLYEIGSLTRDFIMELYNLDCLFGFIAETNKPAIKLMKKLGAKSTGVLIKGAYIKDLNKSIDAILISFWRQD
jgi:RimJ/RimL family protein N-acetyltransferase